MLKRLSLQKRYIGIIEYKQWALININCLGKSEYIRLKQKGVEKEWVQKEHIRKKMENRKMAKINSNISITIINTNVSRVLPIKGIDH